MISSPKLTSDCSSSTSGLSGFFASKFYYRSGRLACYIFILKLIGGIDPLIDSGERTVSFIDASSNGVPRSSDLLSISL